MPTRNGYDNERKARKVVSAHLGVPVDFTGECSCLPDLLVHAASGDYEIDVTLAIDQWRMDQQGALFKAGGNEYLEIPGMPISLGVTLGSDTNIRKLRFH